MTMRLQSFAFAAGGRIPKRHTGDGEDVSPALSWNGVPAGTRAFALIVDDPDAPTSEPWVHWLAWNIPGDAVELPEGIERTAKPKQPNGITQGRNSWNKDNLGYRGPAPPPGHGTHHYHFRLYALDAPLNVPAGSDKKALLAATKGHVLAEAELIGTYER